MGRRGCASSARAREKGVLGGEEVKHIRGGNRERSRSIAQSVVQNVICVRGREEVAKR